MARKRRAQESQPETRMPIRAKNPNRKEWKVVSNKKTAALIMINCG